MTFDQVFLIFPFFFQIFSIFTVLNVVYVPFFTRKTTISENNSLMTPFLLCSYFRASDNTTSQNIGGTDAWAVPHLKFWVYRPPASPP